MLSKNQIKHITSLQQRKYREIHGEFIAEGVKVVGELLTSAFRLKYLCALKDWIDSNHEILKSFSAEIFDISEKELKRISALTTPNKVLAVFEIPEDDKEPELTKDELVLVLDDISDPGNLGTIIRTADWFGIKKIICSPASVDVYNPKTIQSTMGSVSRVRIHYRNLPEFIVTIKNDMPVYATALDGENIYTSELTKGGLILIGSESHGLSDELLNIAHTRLHIPAVNSGSDGSGNAESLNASVAAAIVCSEFRRRSAK